MTLMTLKYMATITNFFGMDTFVIAGVSLLLFGAKLLPTWARSLRQTRDELKKISEENEKAL